MKILTGKMLMSIAVVTVTWGFTACSDDDSPENDPNVIIAGENDPLGEPIGIWYTDFRNANDVTINNSDTTELSISKALADSLRITNFVNRPMGIWDKKEHTPYLRRATEQRLVGDRYVLKVVRSSLAEVIGSRDVTLNTGIYYDPAAPLSRTTRAAAFGDIEASKYVDEENVIHPMAITFLGTSDNGSNSEDGFDPEATYDLSETFTIEELYAMSKDPSNSIFDDIGNWFKKTAKKVASAVEQMVDYIAAKTSYSLDVDKSATIINTNTKLTLKKKFSCGEESKDTIGVTFNCPVQFNLDYTIKAKAQGSIKTGMLPIPSYLETYVNGYLDANPQLLVGFSKELSLPQDKQRVNLIKFTAYKFVFSIGPVPVSITISPNVYLKFTASVAGDAYVGISYDIATKFKAGFKYEHGFSGIGESEVVKNEFDFLRPTVEITAKAGVGVFFGVDINLEEVAGPTFSVGPQVNAEAKLKYVLPDNHLDFTASAKAGIGGEVGGKISLLGFDLAEWKTSFDIGKQWTIFKYPDDGTTENDNPNGKDYSGRRYIPILGTGGTGDCGYDKLLDGNKNTEWTTYEKVGGKWYVEFKSSQPMTINEMLLTTGVASGAPANWKLYVKAKQNDNWTFVYSWDAFADPLLRMPDRSGLTTAYPLFRTFKDVQYFRLEVTKNVLDYYYGFLSLAELDFGYDENILVNKYYDRDYIALEGTPGHTKNENIYKLFDRDVNTQWHAPRPSDYYWYMEFMSKKPITPTNYTMTVANDANGHLERIPYEWYLYAKLNFSDQWVLIDSRNEVDFLDTSKKTFSCKKGTYQYFWLYVYDVYGYDYYTNWKGDQDLQLAEFEFDVK